MSAESESEREKRFIRYLLGALPPEEQEELEERYFLDAALHEELEATADDLIHDYLAGGLSPDERHRFEAHFLKSPQLQARLEFVRSVAAKAARASARSAPRLPPWLGWAAVLAAVGLILFMLRPQTPPPTQTGSQRPSPVPARPAGGTPHSPGPPPIVRVASAAEAVDVIIPTAAASVRFEVAVDGAAAAYDAVIRSLQGAELWRANGLELEREGAPLRFSIPAAILIAGQYVLALEAEALRGEEPAAGPVVKCTLRVRRE